MPELNLKGSTGKLQVKNIGENRSELYIYGDIVDESWPELADFGIEETAPKDVRDFLSQLEGKQDIDVYINSYGGSLFAGLAIYNTIQRSDSNVTVYVDAVAASAASVIALAGSKLVMPSNALFMIHKPLLGTYGNANDLQQAIDLLNASENAMMKVYEDNLKEGVSIDVVRDMVDKETWLTAAEAAEYFNIELQEPITVAAKTPESSIYGQYKHKPSIIKDSENPAATGDKPKPEGVENVSEFEKKVQAKFGEGITIDNIAEWKQKAEEHAALETQVQNLSADAELGKKYKQDLVEDAVKQRVAAQGEYFKNEEGYRNLLNNADIDFIKAEKDAYLEIVKNKFAPGRDTHDQTVSNDGNSDGYEEIN
jgi:ATP-dependent Clp protease, protease subunit